MSDKLQEIKDDFAWGIKAAGQGQGYTNLDDEQVSWLIEQLEQAQRVVATVEQDYKNDMDDFKRQLEQAQASNQKLVECLEWYADDENYEVDVVNQWAPIEPVSEDRGQRARHVLSEVKGNG